VINRGSQEKLGQEMWGERGGSQAGFISAIKSWQSSSLATPVGRGVDKEVTVSACAARQNRNMQNTNFGNPDECVQGRGVLGVIDGNSPKRVESESDVAWRYDLLRKIEYKR
jgi:adenosine specific kinase